MDVIGVGLGRTGTASLKVALERLGFGPCYHMSEVIGRRDRIGQWQVIADGRSPGWAVVFTGYRSTVDWPAAAYWRELLQAYPSAKVILTVRDPQRWYDSASETIFRNELRAGTPMGQRVERMVLALMPDTAALVRMIRATMIGTVLEGRIADRDAAVAAFQEHTIQVTQNVSADRLLVYEVSQGWQPLCDFLGVPVPDEPFPLVNDAEQFRRDRRRETARAVAPAAVVAGAALLAAGALLAASRSNRG